MDNNGNRKTDFIKKAKQIYGNEYDYSKVDYINMKTKVDLICFKHGIFKVIPCNHISERRDACIQCSQENKRLEKEKSLIEELVQINGDRFDYSKIKYLNSKSTVEIICKIHQKSFFQTVIAHKKSKNPCPCCLKDKTNIENLIDEFNIIHKNKYSYIIENYKKGKMEIICKEHGSFF